MSNLEERIQLVSQLLKSTLENFNLFVGVDEKSQEFLFIDREDYSQGNARYAKVKISEINVE